MIVVQHFELEVFPSNANILNLLLFFLQIHDLKEELSSLKARKTERAESKEEWVVLESPRRESGVGKVEGEHVEEEKGKGAREGGDEKEERPASREDQRVSTPDIQLVTRYVTDKLVFQNNTCTHIIL